MVAPALTASTISYLFASEWAPPNGSWPMDVPGATVDGPVTAANLLNLGIWRLQDQDVVAIDQLRPYELEQKGIRRFDEPSFARLMVIDDSVALPGLQGALLRVLKGTSNEGERDVRRLISALDLHHSSPWNGAAGYCLGEAKAAGVADLGGSRWNPFRKPVITNKAALEELRPKHEEIGVARNAYRQRNEELDNAVMADCLQALHWAHGTAES